MESLETRLSILRKQGVVLPEAAMRFAASRSSGPGGQAVNKVNTRIELRIAVPDLTTLPWDAAVRLRTLGRRYLNDRDELVIVSQQARSQLENKLHAQWLLAGLLINALKRPKARVRTKPSRSSVRRRVDAKVRQGKKKQERGWRGEE